MMNAQVTFDIPQDYPTECALLGTVLTYPGACGIAITEGLTAADFYNEQNRTVFNAIRHLHTNHESIDSVTVFARLTDQKEAGKVGGIAYLAGLMEKGTFSANIPDYVRRLKNQTVRRKLLFSAQEGSETEVLSAQVNSAAEMLDDLKRRKEQNGNKPDNVKEYIKGFLSSDIEENQSKGQYRTGFDCFDRVKNGRAYGGFFPGLYVIGGGSSVGKSTFMLQLADNICSYGKDVLYFSLEMSRLELVSKSLSRQSAFVCKGQENAVSAFKIRNGYCQDLAVKQSNGEMLPIMKVLTDSYSDIAQRMNVIEGNFNCTVSYIERYTKNYIERTGKSPAVFVDYFQIIQPDIDPKTRRKPTDSKQIADLNITALKRLSREMNIPVIVASSFNRSNYFNNVSMESFKESGGIEYTADVVMGLQYEAIRSMNGANVNENREALQKAKDEKIRKVEVICVKNRFGIDRDYSARFNYYPHCELFIENTEPAVKTTTGKKRDLL